MSVNLGKMCAIIDIQGFKNENNKLIVKEIAILTNENRMQHFVFLPPYGLQELPPSKIREAKWMQNHHHGFSWRDGYIPYHHLKALITPLLNNKTIYVKGCEKQYWTKQLFGQTLIVINMEEDLQCPKLSFLKYQYPNTYRCLVHQGVCAQENVFLMEKFLKCNNYSNQN